MRFGNVRLLWKLFVFLPFVGILLTGCWDRQEIEERAIVLGIGIDDAGEGAAKEENEISFLHGTIPPPKTGLLRVTVQIAVPGRIPLGPGGGGGGGGEGGGGGQNTVWVVNGVGYTLNDAINNLQQRISPPLFFGHLRIIVISENVAQKGITNLNDFFHRNPDIRRMNWMFICKGYAEELMKASPQLERVPTLYLMNTMDQSVKMGRFPNDFLGIFWSASSAKGREGYLPYITLKPEDTVELSGLAFFRDDKMVGTTKPLEITMYMGIVGLNPAGGEAFVEYPNSDTHFLFGARNRKAVITPEIRNGKPHMKIKVYIEGNILEKSNEHVRSTREVLLQIEQELNKRVIEGYGNLIRKTMAKGSDIFGFGEQIRAKEWRYWNKEIKTKENWQKMYKEMTFDIDVQIYIRRVGMKSR
ncbi:Spore germination protein A3 [Paenibacillus solanacearum]|uniref:Spore germination protein A3 n=1 Tax=Paenibacillus solanacearum TaxID=2048548 RepID=A0A916K554_9BACL|nr:Ger(x)C family spore germination protein [Paenibacillus solanacearum]CAG7627367.1 Spore germination protein A3 [Paenibacillus solanacearum]